MWWLRTSKEFVIQMVPQDDCLWKVELYGIRDALWQENCDKKIIRNLNIEDLT